MDKESLTKEQLAKQLAELREQIIKELDELRESVTSLESSEEKRRELEEALNYSEARNRAILDNAVEGIITIDEQGVIEAFNKAAEGIFGFSAAEAIGKNVTMLMPEPHASRHDGYIRNYLSTGNARIIGIGREVSGRRKDGSEFPMELAVSEVRLGKRRMFTGLIRDITERKKLEREKADFLAMLSHDLKSPLVTVIGYADLMTEATQDTLTRECLNMAGTIRRSGYKMLKMVDDLLLVSRLETTSLQMRKSMVDVAELLSGMLGEMAHLAREKNISLETKTPKTLPNALLDGSYVERAVGNLVHNAVNYTPKGGTVTVRAGIEKKPGNGDLIVISVTDTGPGIPAEYTEKVFDKYFSSATLPGVKHSGLGLAIVKAVAEAHGGLVELDSAVGGGSTFRLYLPLNGVEKALSRTHNNG